MIFFWSCLNTKYLLTKGSFSDRCRLLQFNYKDLSIVTGKQGVRTCVVCLTRGPPASPSERTSRLTRVRATVPGHLVSQGRPQSCLQPFKPHTSSGPSRDFGAASVRGQGSGSRTDCHVCGSGPGLPSLAPSQLALVPAWLTEDGGHIPTQTVTLGGTASHDPGLGSRKSPLPPPRPRVVEACPCPVLCLQLPQFSVLPWWMRLGLDPP